MRTPGWASQRTISADLFDQRAAQRGGDRQNRLRGSAYGVDDRHRRHAASRDARGGELSVPDDREVPAAAAVGPRGDQFGDRGQRAQPLTAPQHVDRGGGVVAQPCGGLVAVALGQLADAGEHRRQRVVLEPVDQCRRAPRRFRVLGGGDVALRRARRQFPFRAGGPVVRRAGEPGGAGAQPGEPGQQVGGLDGVGA